MAAPRAEPEATPRVNGVARGLRNRAWKAIPATARPAPLNHAASTLGSRIFQNISDSLAVTAARSKRSAGVMGVIPMKGARASTTTVPAARNIQIMAVRRGFITIGGFPGRLQPCLNPGGIRW